MIRVRGQGKYELLSTACDDDAVGSNKEPCVEGVLNKRRDDASEDADSVVESTSFCGDATTTTTIGPRHRKSSRGDSEEKKRLLGGEGARENRPDMMELSQKMVGNKKSSRNFSASAHSDFMEVNIRDDDTLQGLALKFRCPVSELKRVNNIYSTQDIHSFNKIKVPVKKHGLLQEILDDDSNKRRSKRRSSKRSAADAGSGTNGVDESVVRITDEELETEKTDRLGKLVDLSVEDDSGIRRNHPDSAYNEDPRSSSPTCRYGIKDLENLFPNRDISDCESGAESRRLSLSGGGGSDSGGGASDSASSAPLVRTFYLSIRENMSSPSNQSRLAKQFLSKMDADLSSIRKQRPTVKNSLDDVTTTLTSKRIHPLASSSASVSSPPRVSASSSSSDAETFGTILGMSWQTLLAIAVGTGLLLFFVFFNYAREREDELSDSSSQNRHLHHHPIIDIRHHRHQTFTTAIGSELDSRQSSLHNSSVT